MKLSEAIRLGAMLRPQGRFALSKNGTTCALGAAYEAIGIWHESNVGYPIMEKAFPWFSWMCDRLARCPACGGYFNFGAVTHLNDNHKWTREAIADWVESIEAQFTAPEGQHEPGQGRVSAETDGGPQEHEPGDGAADERNSQQPSQVAG